MSPAHTQHLKTPIIKNKPSLSKVLKIFTPAFFVTVSILGILFFAYLSRAEYYWQADHGIGYTFGIAGSSFMVMLLLYPLRKRSAAISFFLSVKQWFKFHMFLGVVGPALILLHCNFSFGSLNSTIALISMLLMVSSGLVGRFIYSKIHRGLYGSRLEMTEIYEQKKNLLASIARPVQSSKNKNAIQKVSELLKKLEASTNKPTSVIGNFFRLTLYSFTTRKFLHSMKRKLAQIELDNTINTNSEQNDSAVYDLQCLTNAYIRCVRKTVELNFYERLFSLWHIFHLPIFGLLVLSMLFHIYAVHSY